jgi:hypothetical protein
MQHLLGVGNFSRDFCKGYAKVTATLHDATKKGFDFGTVIDEMRAVLDSLKESLRNAVALGAINKTQEVVLRTDASNVACGFELVNVDAVGKDIPILFGSHKFSERASSWPTIEQEMFALYWSITVCRDLLQGIHFIVETDHANLRQMNRSVNKKLVKGVILVWNLRSMSWLHEDLLILWTRFLQVMNQHC